MSNCFIMLECRGKIVQKKKNSFSIFFPFFLNSVALKLAFVLTISVPWVWAGGICLIRLTVSFTTSKMGIVIAHQSSV